MAAENGYSATANNGNVMSQTLTPLNVTQNFEYDRVNRLKKVIEGSAWWWTFDYDARGNQWVSEWSGLSPGSFTATAASWYDGQNRMIGVPSAQFDEADNQTHKGAYTFGYDAESRVKESTISGATTSYAYDGQGRRVKKALGSNTTMFVYDAFGQLAAEYGPEESGEPRTSYLTADHLGSTRVVTDPNGEVTERHDYRPFGEELFAGVSGRTSDLKYPGGDTGVRLKFTGKERDQETGLDYFGARYFSGAQGRFTSPDPLMWVRWQAGNDSDQGRFHRWISDPQNLNLYGYVRNNPLRFTDPSGMYYCTGTGAQCAAFQAGLNKASEAAKSTNLTPAQRGAIQKVLTFYGAKQKPNGVVVEFGKTPTGSGGGTSTDLQFHVTTITLNPKSFAARTAEGNAEVAVHEGIHGIDQKAGVPDSTRAEVKAGEIRAYTVQSYVPEGLGVFSRWGLWDPGWPAEAVVGNRAAAIERNAEGSTQKDCEARGGCRQ